jgi:hypothetical protein
LKIRSVITLLTITALWPGTSQASDRWIAEFDRVGPIRIGMSPVELSSLLRQRFQMPDDPRERACVYVAVDRPKGLSLMFVDGQLARIDVTSREFPTAEGARVGDPEEQVKRRYGARLKVTPHHYTGPDGHYFTVPSDGGRLGLRFETYQGRVSVFYVGKFPQIEYVEQCL